ncbi:nucleotide-diphospho-sugar transferase [Sistotremastrum suecicum HHB10207 ss-3]|uniref:Translation initiation factor eIF2B subunit epsilon n=1 Tax=Sistotremastrum suecicum HHB10207 ss-3 TaxID=1314776 RepID=A0A166ITD3_9AGAM|nr:nucleotide-diphospho-sugar transferase [Sistotremastrum suecicum HHB10207 ss-3]
MAPRSSGKDKSLNDEDEVLQAVILADSFNGRFKPLTINRPRCLLPICNATLLDWTFEGLVLAGVQEIFVVTRSHSEQIKEAIQKSKWSRPEANLKITPIVTAKESFSPGDALRDIYTHGIITSDFVLVSGDLVSNVAIQDAVRVHKDRRKTNKDAIMTMVVRNVGGSNHRTRFVRFIPRGETGLFVLDPETSECLHYEPVPASPYKTHAHIPREILVQHPEVEIRNDLLDCSIDICSVEVPSLFQDNFDYQDIRRDFVRGILQSDLLNRNIHCYVVNDGYAARVKDTKSYAAISKDILSRWTFPLVPGANYPGETNYEHQRGNRYVPAERSTVLARNCKVGRNTLIGRLSRIHDGAEMISSTLGDEVVVGPDSVIKDSYIFDGCHIGRKCVIDQCIIGHGVRIHDRTVLRKGSIVGDGVVLGPDVTIPEFSRISTFPFDEEDDDDDDEEKVVSPKPSDAPTKAVLGAAAHGYLWPPFSEEEDEGADEFEDFENSRFLRLGVDSSELDLSDPGSDSDSDDEDAGNASDVSEVSQPTSLAPLGADGASVAEFLSECTQSLERAFAEGHSVDNAAVELKTLRMASNVPLRRVKEVVVSFFVEKIRIVDGAAEQRKEVTKVIGRWGALLTSIGGADGVETCAILQAHCASTPKHMTLFGPVMAALYSSDVVDEDDIREWHSRPESLGRDKPAVEAANMLKCRGVGSVMLRQFDEQEDDSEDSE